MQPSLGVIKADPRDGVLRGRAGAKRWFYQLLALLIGGLIFGIMEIVFFVQKELVAFIVFLVLIGLIGLGLRVFALPCAFLGCDWCPPTVFDLAAGRFEIGGWKGCVFERKTLAGGRVEDLQVFRASVGAKGFDELQAFREASAIQSELPQAADAARECGKAFKQLFAVQRPPADVACGVLAARVRDKMEPVFLSRCAWNLREVQELFRLAQAAREQLGLPETNTPTASSARSVDQAPQTASRNGRTGEEPPPQVVGSAEATSASVAPSAGGARSEKSARVVRFADHAEST